MRKRAHTQNAAGTHRQTSAAMPPQGPVHKELQRTTLTKTQSLKAKLRMWVFRSPLESLVWVVLSTAIMAVLTIMLRPSLEKFASEATGINPGEPISWMDSFVTEDTMQIIFINTQLLITASMIVSASRWQHIRTQLCKLEAMDVLFGGSAIRHLTDIDEKHHLVHFQWPIVEDAANLAVQQAVDASKKAQERGLEVQRATYVAHIRAVLAFMQDPLDTEIMLFLTLVLMFLGPIKAIHNFHTQGPASIPVNIFLNVVNWGVVYIISRIQKSYFPRPTAT